MNTTCKLTTVAALVGFATLHPKTTQAEDWNCFVLEEGCPNFPNGEIFVGMGYPDYCDGGTRMKFLSCDTQEPWAPHCYVPGEYLPCGPCSS